MDKTTDTRDQKRPDFMRHRKELHAFLVILFVVGALALRIVHLQKKESDTEETWLNYARLIAGNINIAPGSAKQYEDTVTIKYQLESSSIDKDELKRLNKEMKIQFSSATCVTNLPFNLPPDFTVNIMVDSQSGRVLDAYFPRADC